MRIKKKLIKSLGKRLKIKKLVFTEYYKFSILSKGIDHERVMGIFPRFEDIFAIEIETLKHGDIGYELFYKLSNNVTFSIATCPKNNSLIIIHAVEYKRSLEKRFKKF